MLNTDVVTWQAACGDCWNIHHNDVCSDIWNPWKKALCQIAAKKALEACMAACLQYG
jgi:hypothetical protein